MKYLVILVAVTLLAGCGKVDKMEASWTGHSKKCIDGVLYLQFASGATVAYNRDGTIRTCN